MQEKKDEQKQVQKEVAYGTTIITVLYFVFIICMILFLIWLYRRYTS